VFGWRWVFLGLVLPGLIIAVFAFLLKEPIRGLADSIDVEIDARGLAPAAKDDGKGGKHARKAASEPVVEAEVDAETATSEVNLLSSSVWRDMIALLKNRSLRLVLISQGLLFLGLGGLFFWTPRFYERAFDLESGAASGIAGGMGLVGILIGFGLSIRLGDRYQGVRRGWRVLLGSIGASIGVVGLLILAVAPSIPLSILGWITVNIGFFLSVPAFTASLADLSSARRRGLAFALSVLVIQATSSIAPAIIGAISDFVVAQGWAESSTSLRYSFAFLAIPVIAGIFVALRARSTYDAEAAEARRVDASTT
jgi:hypothetical protein